MPAPSYPGWTISKTIGHGTFGTVYEIERDLFGAKEKAALKVVEIPQDESLIDQLKHEGFNNDEIQKILLNSYMQIIDEYRIMSEMKDVPYIVHCEDFQYTPHENGIGWTLFIRMELLSSLSEWAEDKNDDTDAINLAVSICGALFEMEKRNMLHRDINPQNIFVSRSGYFKLGDLGVAQKTEKSLKGKVGTLRYMAPEVFKNGSATFASDIYSLGLTLYWLMNNGCLPFSKKTMQASDIETAVNMRMSGAMIPPPANGSRELKEIILKACSYDPHKRYQNANEMLTAIFKDLFYKNKQYLKIKDQEILIPAMLQTLRTHAAPNIEKKHFPPFVPQSDKSKKVLLNHSLTNLEFPGMSITY
ncbi:MAG: serine/threonine protein kinase [Clostridia bacterium]|nr:serine/threonine protein kinase [Clostridia bacterium]MBQ6383949.1 serine/threonine protein kinase [Clostridia bacterium]